MEPNNLVTQYVAFNTNKQGRRIEVHCRSPGEDFIMSRNNETQPITHPIGKCFGYNKGAPKGVTSGTNENKTFERAIPVINGVFESQCFLNRHERAVGTLLLVFCPERQ